MRDFQLPGRSPVYATEGMAATSNPLATLTAIETLKAGGTAADAAVAAVGVLGIVEPHMTGIGGDCFCLISQPGKPVWGYNGSGRAGSAASTDALLAQGIRAIDPSSAHAVTVPGAVEAWEAVLKRYGRFGLDRALQAAIHVAENGFVVAPRVHDYWASGAERLRANPGAARHYLVGDRAPAIGDVFKSPAMAQTLRVIASRGARAFYEGPIAEEIAATVASRGSFLRAEDFAAHRGNAVDPISTDYRGRDVLEIPPNGQGITALVLLNILENFDLKALDANGPDRFHLVLEAARLAMAVRDTHVADIDHMRVAVSALLDKSFAKSLAGKIDRQKRAKLPTAPSPGSDTTYVTVVDRDRTVVSLINSLFAAFGSGICTENSGIMLNNRGSGFVVAPGHPNTIGASKRPLHTIIPGLIMREGRCDMSFGVIGAHYQSVGQAQVVSNMLDYGMDVQQAIDAPRVFFAGEQTVVERGVSQAAIEGLRARGHNVVVAATPWGAGQAIQIDWQRGTLIGGSDPRKDGCALGY